MAYVTLDDRLAHHKKVRALPRQIALAAYGLHVAAIGFCQLYETDGVIRREDLALVIPTCPRPPARLMAALVDVRLWEPRPDGGWTIHDYLDHNYSAEERRDQSERARAAASVRWSRDRTGRIANRNPERIAKRTSERTAKGNAAPTPDTRNQKPLTRGMVDNSVDNSDDPTSEPTTHAAPASPARRVDAVGAGALPSLDPDSTRSAPDTVDLAAIATRERRKRGMGGGSPESIGQVIGRGSVRSG